MHFWCFKMPKSWARHFLLIRNYILSLNFLKDCYAINKLFYHVSFFPFFPLGQKPMCLTSKLAWLTRFNRSRRYVHFVILFLINCFFTVSLSSTFSLDPIMAFALCIWLGSCNTYAGKHFPQALHKSFDLIFPSQNIDVLGFLLCSFLSQ